MTPASLLVSPERAAELKALAGDGPGWALTARQQGELELLVSGAFWPLTGYATAADHAAILADGRLADGRLADATPWPLPITLDVPTEVADQAVAAGHLALRDAEGVLLAVLAVTEHYVVDVEAEATALYDSPLPEGNVVVDGPGWWQRQHRPDRLAGRIEGVEPATHWSFPDRRRTPAQSTRLLAADDPGADDPGADDPATDDPGTDDEHVLGLAAREPLHRADVRTILSELALDAAAADLQVPQGGRRAGPPHLLVLGVTGPGPDQPFDPHLLVRCWTAVLAGLPDHSLLVVSPLGSSGTGRRDDQLRALVLANHGATRVLIPPSPADERGPDDDRGRDDDPTGADPLSPDELRHRLATGADLPTDFTYPEVEDALRRRYPPLAARGLTVFFTGFSGSGKSTVAQALAARLADRDDRSVALLDGDRVRHHLSSELGFSREHRNLNIRRIGFVAGEVSRAGGIAICAPIAPYDEVRGDVRAMVTEAGGSFVLVHISTPLEVCEARDRKGLYAKARAGVIPEFTGISDPYEVPTDAELTIDTTDLDVTQAVELVLAHLDQAGLAHP